jgi:hypothetical protein
VAASCLGAERQEADGGGGRGGHFAFGNETERWQWWSRWPILAVSDDEKARKKK